MPSGKEAAAVWRAKAEEARANAAQATERQARATFLKIAEAYTTWPILRRGLLGPSRTRTIEHCSVDGVATGAPHYTGTLRTW
jgi:hypothetical protein